MMFNMLQQSLNLSKSLFALKNGGRGKASASPPPSAYSLDYKKRVLGGGHVHSSTHTATALIVGKIKNC